MVLEDSQQLSASEATRCRAIVARLNYLSQDRSELQYVTQEVSQRMATSRENDWKALKRVGRFLVGALRTVQVFEWQNSLQHFDTYADSDWAGDRDKAKSTSGGAVTLGGHTLKTWSKRQQVVALSSGEAELYALTRAASQTLGMMSLAADFGMGGMSGILHTDSTAAKGPSHSCTIFMAPRKSGGQGAGFRKS